MRHLAEQAHRDADAYRGYEPRPLGGYFAVLCMYAGAVTLTSLLAAASGRRLPRRWRTQDLAIVTLGTHKLSRTLTKDAVTSPLGAPFAHYGSTAGPAEVHEKTRRSSQLRHSLGEVLTCPFCLDVWVATAFAIGLVFAPRLTRLVGRRFHHARRCGLSATRLHDGATVCRKAVIRIGGR